MSDNRINKIQKIAEQVLSDGTAQMVIGFKKGTVPLMNEPCFITDAGDAGQLVWDGNCGINLANYLTNRTEKIAIVAKGCDSRNILTHIIENKIKREQLFIIGVPCDGMIDKKRIQEKSPGEIRKVTENDNIIIVSGNGFEETLERDDLLQENCRVCTHKNPVISDKAAGDPVPESPDVDRYEDVRRIEAMTSDEKSRFFRDLLSPCIRCYACRNACPLCYCPTCFVDESRPQWVGKGLDFADIETYHFLRAFHCAGRCTDCGACERACPVGINMRTLTKKLEQDTKALYDWEAGLTPDTRPALDTYKADDPEDFIK